MRTARSTHKTRKLLLEARRLALARDEAGLDRLVADNSQNRLFVSMVELQRALIPAIVQVWREKGLLLD